MKDELKIPRPKKLRLEQVVGRQKKLSDKAPSGGFMDRGVSLTEASGVAPQTDGFTVRGACQPITKALDPTLPIKDMQEHNFGDLGTL